MAVTREQVLAFRVRRQGLHRTRADRLTDVPVLDLGVQDTGSDGAGWALALRGLPPDAAAPERRMLAWTLRGAPHSYRRADVAGVAAATAPWSDADACKRIFDAVKPLRAAGIAPLAALDTVADALRDIVRRPTVKGEASAELTRRLPAPYLRECRPCNATHVYEQPFRLAALRAGLELEPGTSPPVLRPVAGWSGPAKQVPEALDVVRAYLRLLGPATPRHVAAYLDSPVAEVKRHWPADAVPVDVDGEKRDILEGDRAELGEASVDPGTVRLLGAFDLFLQARDRELIVPGAARRKQLWVILGRPGAVLVGGEVAGTWRPQARSGRLQIAVDPWRRVDDDAVAGQAERLAEFRGLRFAGVTTA